MSYYGTLITAIKQVIKENGNQEITGQILQDILVSMIDDLGAYPTFAGIVYPDEHEVAPTAETETGENMEIEQDANVFYLAYEAGQYSGFGVTLDGETYNIIRRTSQGWEVVNTNITTEAAIGEAIAEVIAEALEDYSTTEQMNAAIAQAVEGVNAEIIDNELVAAAALNDLNDRVKKLPTKENISEEIDAKLQTMRNSIVAMIDTLRAEVIDNELVAAASLNDLDRRMSDLPTTEQVEKDIENNTKEIYKLIDGVRNDIIEDELVAAAAITDLNNNI